MSIAIIYRSMRKEADGLPALGESSSTLGARAQVDIPVDTDGRVGPKTGGMSVAPDDPKRLPKPRRPLSLGGTGRHPVFALPVGALKPVLVARVDRPPDHAAVEPADVTTFEQYQAQLWTTRVGWGVAHE